MRNITRKLILSAVGGGLLVLGLLSGYNMISTKAPFYSIPAIVFLVVSGIAFWKSFE